ncbi:cytochrome c-type biogenesis protein CcmF [Ectothiorhodosinus mongolicus]|uniref:Cytochrome c-type biogenesis protein CcmF n=1 Tax=Ectothiorhodosinus mongolicus TaxID=233100 RepID=A0A1R3VYL2_9GAMM|nr:heme lyase CcmF/NrfE family subunit [Ectothiorhodosinus mongolicus]ULX57186.1 heme lyase CcmF/NrfE family subunit [Ectothiorhodosinus mongolicus]SIT70317.1 cytochrome c-type biogenesis protein CcmF [Ectothiorhodosinus mongolicus]
MIPEIGQMALVLALLMAAVQGTIPLIGAHRGTLSWMRTAHTAVAGQFIFLLIAYLALTYAFITHDFSVAYVANHSNTALPLMYRISGVWGGHEGSLVLWALMLGGWSLAVSLFSKGLPTDMAARTIAVMGLVSVGILSFTLFTSNPFEALFPIPADGRDLNPLLQDPGLVIHPPMLYMGYVGLAVPFAIAVAALIGGKLDATWARWTRPWATSAWAFLGAGIALGSWWAYYTLGWGGWWFWDPVENASLMPWLAATALIHSLAATEKRGVFRSWTVLLAISAFCLSLLGTFLVRSGVLVSVHAFATDPTRGVYILMLLLAIAGSSFLLYAWRAPKVRSQTEFHPVSRESGLLVNNVIMVVALAAVLLGTLYPLFLDALNMGKISVGPPYFNSVFAPLMVPLVFMVGLGPLLRWKRSSAWELSQRLWHTLLAAVVVGVIFPLVMVGSTTFMVTVGMAMAFWIVFSIGRDLYQRARKQGTPMKTLRKMPAGYWGMSVAHFGFAILVMGITMLMAFESETDVRLGMGQSHTLGGYTFELQEVYSVAGPNWDAIEARVGVTRDGSHVTDLFPQRRVYRVQTMPMAQASYQSNLLRDIFVALGEPMSGNTWSLRLYHNPFQSWLWIGATFIVLGGFIAAADRRYRVFSRRRSEALAKENRIAESKPDDNANPSGVATRSSSG